MISRTPTLLAALFLTLNVAPGEAATRHNFTFDSYGTMAYFYQGELQEDYPQGTVSADPGPGGLSAVLNYLIGFMPDPMFMVSGDVQLCRSLEYCDETTTDILRFNSIADPETLIVSQTLYIYSNPFFDLIGAPDGLADTPTSPMEFYANRLFFEIPAGESVFVYRPEPGQPGYLNPVDDIVLKVSYTYVTKIPEPAAALLVVTALGALAATYRRRAGTRR